MKKQEALESIVSWFKSDTIEFVDKVLSDSLTDPQYSAVTMVNRIKIYLQYIESKDTVEDFLLKSGYSKEYSDVLEEKRAKESKYYIGEQL